MLEELSAGNCSASVVTELMDTLTKLHWLH
jgi:hypothetical protein